MACSFNSQCNYVASRWEVLKFARVRKVLATPFKVADKEGCPGSGVSLQVVNWLVMRTAEAGSLLIPSSLYSAQLALA